MGSRRLVGALVAVLLALCAAPAAAAPGALTQLGSPHGCLTDTAALGCQPFAGFTLAPPPWQDVAVSPDGASAYLASTSGLAVFSRDPHSGVLTQLAGAAGCLDATGAGGCTAVRGLTGAFDAQISISPDGGSLYLATNDAGLLAFARDTTTGALTQLAGGAGCFEQTSADSCTVVRSGSSAFLPFWSHVSPDGRNVYAGTGPDEANGSLWIFQRNTATGALTLPSGAAGCIDDDGTDGGGGVCQEVDELGNAADVAFSPAGTRAWVLAPYLNTIVGFSRDATSGALTPLPGAARCVVNADDAAGGPLCGQVRALNGEQLMAIAPDGSNLYVTSGFGESDAGVAAFAIDAGTGALSQLPGLSGCLTTTGHDGEASPGACAHGNGDVDHAREIVASSDGHHVYVEGENSGDLVTLARGAGGALSDASCVGDNTGGTTCVQATDMSGLDSVAISAGGASVYGATTDGAVAFARELPPPDTGGGGGGGGGGGAGGPVSPPHPAGPLVGHLGVPNPATFTPPSSTHVSGLFHLVASGSPTGAAQGAGCLANGGCKPLPQLGHSAVGQCLTVVGGNSSLALTGTCMKLLAVQGTSYLLQSSAPVSADGVTFDPAAHDKLTITETTGANAAEQFLVTGTTADVTFESVTLDQGTTRWQLDQLASGGFDSAWSHGGSPFDAGAAPVPSGSSFNGLPVTGSTMPTFAAGSATIQISAAAPAELGAGTSIGRVPVTNGALARAISVGSSSLFAAGDALSDARSCLAAEQAPVHAGPGSFTIPYPDLSYHGVGIEGGSLTIAGPLHYLAKVRVGLPFPASGNDLAAVLEVYDGHLRFGCAAQDFGSTPAPLPGMPIAVKHIDLGFAADNGSDQIAGDVGLLAGAPIPGVGDAVTADGQLELTTHPLGGDPWTLHAAGNVAVAGISDTNGHVDYASSGYLQAGIGFGAKDLLGFSLGPASVSGAMDGSGKWFAQGTGKAAFAGLTLASGSLLISNVGVGICGGVFGGHAGYTSTWQGGIGLLAGFGACSAGDLSAMAPAIEATCQQLQFIVDHHIPIASAGAAAALAAGNCVNVPGSVSAARAHAAAAPVRGPAGRTLAVQLPNGSSADALSIHGSGGAPVVALIGPDGRRIATPPAGATATGDANALGLRDAAGSLTTFELRKVKPGAWLIEVAPGSPAVTSVGVAKVLPPLAVHASVAAVRGSAARLLRYRIGNLDGRGVTFVERAGGLERTLGVARGARGTLRFTPLDGPAGRRTILAAIGRGRVPDRLVAVTTYRAPGPRRLPAPRALRIAGAGHSARVAFSRVGGARGYRVRLVVSDGRHLTLIRRTTRLTIGQLEPGRTAIVVTVTALDAAGRAGRSRTARRLIALAAPRIVLPRRIRRRSV
jgi:hypothetical protein